MTLHKAITACALVGNGYFEVSFAIEEGVKHTLSHVFFFEGKEVPFMPWNADFSSENPSSSTLLEHPLWLQFLGLGLPLRNETCLRILGGKYGQVLCYEDSASYLGRTAGPRIKVLVKDITKIPDRIRLRGSTEGVFQEHKILVTGLPNQCAVCHFVGHPSKNCPTLRKTSFKKSPSFRPNQENYTDRFKARVPKPGRKNQEFFKEQAKEARQKSRKDKDLRTKQDGRQIRQQPKTAAPKAPQVTERQPRFQKERNVLHDLHNQQEFNTDNHSSHTTNKATLRKHGNQSQDSSTGNPRSSGSFADALFRERGLSAQPDKSAPGLFQPPLVGEGNSRGLKRTLTSQGDLASRNFRELSAKDTPILGGELISSPNLIK